MRLAFVSPLPPAPTGIADYTMDVARALRGSHAIELFHDQEQVSASLPLPAFPVADLPARAASEPYDAVVYQMGNAPAHDFMYDWMERVPGAVVLHDLPALEGLGEIARTQTIAVISFVGDGRRFVANVHLDLSSPTVRRAPAPVSRADCGSRA